MATNETYKIGIFCWKIFIIALPSRKEIFLLAMGSLKAN